MLQSELGQTRSPQVDLASVNNDLLPRDASRVIQLIAMKLYSMTDVTTVNPTSNELLETSIIGDTYGEHPILQVVS